DVTSPGTPPRPESYGKGVPAQPQPVRPPPAVDLALDFDLEPRPDQRRGHREISSPPSVGEPREISPCPSPGTAFAFDLDRETADRRSAQRVDPAQHFGAAERGAGLRQVGRLARPSDKHADYRGRVRDRAGKGLGVLLVVLLPQREAEVARQRA